MSENKTQISEDTIEMQEATQVSTLDEDEPNAQELTDIENKIFSTAIEVGPVPVQSETNSGLPSLDTVKPKKSKKKDLALKIIELQQKEQAVYPDKVPMTESKLCRMRVTELEEILANTINEGVARESMAQPMNTDVVPDVKEITKSTDFIAKQLLTFNLLVASLVEQVSVHLGGEENNVVGYTKNLNEARESLFEAYILVAAEYKEQLSAFLSPLTIVLTINIASASRAFIEKNKINEDIS
jgi:hypothetical protein